MSAPSRRRLIESVRLVWIDALGALDTRRASAAACGAAAALAVGVFVATGVLAASDRLAVANEFAALDRPVVTLQGASTTEARGGGVMRLRQEDLSRISGVAGVTAVSRLADLGGAPAVTGHRRADVLVVAADPAGMAASGAKVLEGRAASQARAPGALPEIVLGSAIARELELPTVALGPVVRMYGTEWSVVGVVDSGDARPDAARVAFVPWRLAHGRARERTQALVRTRPGYQHHLAPTLARIALPQAPDELAAELPASPDGLRQAVDEAIARVVHAIAIVTLLGGLLALFQTTSSSVLRRTREIGLRRALGARRRVIAAQIELEVLTVGAAGSVIGAAVGVCAAAATAHQSEWPLVVPLPYVAVGILAGSLASVLAGAIPAYRASTIDPTQALRVD